MSLRESLFLLKNRPWLMRKRVVRLLRGAKPLGWPRPVMFMGGVPRNGTNLTLEILERSVDTDVFREADRRAFQRFELRSSDVLRSLASRSTARLVVFKALLDAHRIRDLMGDFAPAKAVWITRHYDDSVNSHLHRFPGVGKRIAAMVADRNAVKGWETAGMSDATYALLKKLHHPAMTPASAIALFWCTRSALFFDQRLDTDPRVATLQYEALVRGPDPVARRLFAFLDLPYDPFVVGRVHSESVRKHAAPEIEPAVREVCDAMLARFEPVYLR